MTAPKLDDVARRRHKFRNVLHSVVLLAGIVALLTVTGWLVLGFTAAMWLLAIWAILMMVTPKISPGLVLRLYNAQQLQPSAFPAGFSVLHELARRAGLDRPPRLFYIPSAVLTAFTIGSKADAAIAVSDGLLRTLNGRELAGVLAHEISHIKNNDLWVMNLADGISRLTSLLSYIGLVLLVLSLPMFLLEGSLVLVPVSLLLLVAPTLSSLLQLALSRAREFDADLDAANLTGDPVGLAAALDKLERRQAGLWERILLPGRRIPDPSLLRSHPTTESRIERLLSLQGTAYDLPPATMAPPHLQAVTTRPRWRRSGLWY